MTDNWQIPINQFGTVISFYDNHEYYSGNGLCFAPKETVWELDLEYMDYTWGRSKTLFRFKSVDSDPATPKIWPFSVSEFHKIVPFMDCGRIRGRFGVVKRGKHYSMTYLDDTYLED